MILAFVLNFMRKRRRNRAPVKWSKADDSIQHLTACAWVITAAGFTRRGGKLGTRNDGKKERILTKASAFWYAVAQAASKSGMTGAPTAGGLNLGSVTGNTPGMAVSEGTGKLEKV
jgi:hypothetical protein